MYYIYLHPGKEKPVRHHHPWIFSGAINKVKGDPQPGQVVAVLDSKENFLAWGYYNPQSQIAVRLLEWEEDEQITDDWWLRHLHQAIKRRQNLFDDSSTNAFRLVNSEADLMPGLILDKYGDYLVLQALTTGIEKVKHLLAHELNKSLKPLGIYERSDSSTRALEGLPTIKETMFGKEPPDLLEIRENGFRFYVNITEGQKTGFYLDQRENRKIVASFAQGRQVLDCFSYTGAFGIYAVAAGAEGVMCIDSSAKALKLLYQNYERNRYLIRHNAILQGDAFEILRKFRDEQKKFDMIILDPPKLAPTKNHLKKAQRAYKDLNMLAMQLLRSDGILATFSCSGAVTTDLFRKFVAWASVDAGREVQILRTLNQSEDHPVRLSFPESEYLKGLICRVI